MTSENRSYRTHDPKLSHDSRKQDAELHHTQIPTCLFFSLVTGKFGNLRMITAGNDTFGNQAMLKGS